MANYLKQIPYSMEEAGTVTGATWFRVLGNILLKIKKWVVLFFLADSGKCTMPRIDYYMAF